MKIIEKNGFAFFLMLFSSNIRKFDNAWENRKFKRIRFKNLRKRLGESFARISKRFQMKDSKLRITDCQEMTGFY